MSTEPSEESIRQHLERVLSSPGFARNERLSRFLRFVVQRHLEGRDAEVKEWLIAVEVFGRSPDYDPKQYSIVRTEAGRLRARLGQYYAGAGKGDRVIVELPKGGYTVVFRKTDAVEAEISPSGGAKPESRFQPHLFKAALACFALTLTAVGWWVFQRQSAPIRIAVLPLNNLSPDPADDYFADGLTDELIRNLAIIEGLAVRSQTSSFAFKGKQRNVREAGHQLEADYLVEGSVLRDRRRLRINVQLIRVRDDFPLWSGRFDREPSDVFAIQEQISTAIVNNLRLKLGRGRRRYETSVEAYNLYLRARSLLYERGTPGQVESIGILEQAIAQDASFAPAYAGLAAAYSARSAVFVVDHPADELEKMRAAGQKALELDPLLAEAQEALGMADAREGKWDLAEQRFHRAIELDRHQPLTYEHLAVWLLMPLGRVEEAVSELLAAERNDPLSPPIQRALSFALISAQRYDDAARHCDRLAREDSFKRRLLGRARLGQGRIGEAISLLNNGDTSNQGFLGYAYALCGRRVEAERLAGASANYPNQGVIIYAGLGDIDRAIDAFERMVPEGPGRIGQYLTYPELRALRNDARVKALCKKVGLPE